MSPFKSDTRHVFGEEFSSDKHFDFHLAVFVCQVVQLHGLHVISIRSLEIC